MFALKSAALPTLIKMGDIIICCNIGLDFKDFKNGTYCSSACAGHNELE